MIEPDDSDEIGEEWKRAGKADNPRNEMDYENSVICNTHSNIPFDQQNWTINNGESMRVDVKHKNTYFSLVLGERPYIEVYKLDQFGGLLMPPDRIFDLGTYFNT